MPTIEQIDARIHRLAERRHQLGRTLLAFEGYTPERPKLVQEYRDLTVQLDGLWRDKRRACFEEGGGKR